MSTIIVMDILENWAGFATSLFYAGIPNREFTEGYMNGKITFGEPHHIMTDPFNKMISHNVFDEKIINTILLLEKFTSVMIKISKKWQQKHSVRIEYINLKIYAPNLTKNDLTLFYLLLDKTKHEYLNIYETEE